MIYEENHDDKEILAIKKKKLAEMQKIAATNHLRVIRPDQLFSRIQTSWKKSQNIRSCS
jgi:hypothetical protein